ncbi:hypothetical protein SAMN04488535_0261 [Corynebacterium mycetoides]|uniref:DUF2218 domain-containing protein n=1 Tax=Corynebacterium mycetoides TaxID=38302 RepID=A0A1G9LPV7_9CORY|nr:DUF2218 domain-containing protein [Corynebacterium mycetoides]SDL63963.1 hypothetical protein SAMN04488535_0261 [Corynebacterium mycetoides]
MPELVTSTARVATERPARYAKQLASHLGRKIDTNFDAETGRGQLVFPKDDNGVPLGTCDMLCGDEVLVLAMEAPAEHIDRAEEIVGSHLLRFGQGDGLEVGWVRAAT